MAAELGQQTMEFSALVRRATEDSFLALRELVDRSKAPEEQSDAQKKVELLKYIFKTRQRMLRLHVLAKWCQQVPLIQYCQQLAATLSSHDTCFTQAADSLFFTHEGLQQARAPIYDVPSAIEVLLTGSYRRLPKCIEDMGLQTTLTDDQQMPVLKNLDTLLRSKLLEVQLPKEISEVKVCDGTLLLRVNGEFKVLLTLGYRGHLSLWRILHLELLVGERNGPVKLEESRRYVLGDDLERRMAAAEKPFNSLYSILHEFCIALVMDTVIRQVQLLRQGRWKDAIRFELISDGSSGQSSNVSPVLSAQDGDPDSTGQKTPGLKIVYWLDFEKTAAGTDSGSSPFIKIEPGQDLQIRCLHSAFVLDPLTDKEAEFSLDQSCIDVEGLLLRAIACSRHARLLEIQREINKNAQICQAAGDVVLKHLEDGIVQKSTKEHWGDEVLHVRTYGSLYITLGINIRNGRFLLQSPKNIFVPSALLECEEALNQGSMTAAEVFVSLRSKSILHLFASVGRFLGLKVCESDLATLKIPKSIQNGSDSLLMGFAQCGSSYYLLMQLDRDFRPVFKLLETQPDSGGVADSGEYKHVVRCNKIDIGQIEVVEDELNLSLLNWEKMQSSVSIIGGPNQTSENGLISDYDLGNSLQLTGPQSSFSSVVDEVFEFEKGACEHPHPIQNHLSSSFSAPTLSQLSSLQMMKAGIGSPKWEGGPQHSQISSMPKVSSSGSAINSCIYSSNHLKGLLQNAPVNTHSSSPLRVSSIHRLSSSQSDQDLSSAKSPSQTGANGLCSAVNDDQERLQNGSPKEGCAGIVKSRPGRLISLIRTSGSRLSLDNTKLNGLKNSPNGYAGISLRTDGSTLSTGTSLCQASMSGISQSSDDDSIPKYDKNLRKRSLSDIFSLLPSLQEYDSTGRLRKRRKVMESTVSHSSASQVVPSATSKTDLYTYGSILSEANHGLAPPNVYVSALLHVVRHCSLCIKHAQLTSQMDALEIPYVEEVGLRTPSVNLWFRLPFVRDDSWQHICLRLGKPGSMSWDVKVNDPYFKELWELQKGSTSTGWACGVRIANASDTDSHIHFDPEGVVLSYETVEVDSIKKLVSDLRRLSNARLFACGMRKLLGVRCDDKLEDGSESKIQSSGKGCVETGDKMSEQIRRSFRIEAVGLMSLWFCYGTMPVMAHFVVDWEAGKEGCTMHVSPDQLWPHTKFLEDFINGGEVASFLDCIRLTAGPLLALSGAIRPARMPGPVASGPSPILKQNGFLHSQGLMPNASSANVNQPASSGPVANAAVNPLANHGLQSAAMLSAASGRGGPGIVPSSLLPFDVSVVLRGPYWVRIIYRKKFAVDMRCFAGDQVWLQPATPPKDGPATGGSLPCPQFRPFIMEHVAQGLNALEPSFPGGAHPSGLMSSNSANPSPGTQPLVPSGNRVSITAPSGMSRPSSIVVTQGTGSLNRVGNTMLTPSGLAAVGPGLPLRIPPGSSVPVHVRGELNTAFIGLGDDGGYGGGWVPLAALKKVLRGILKYLGVLWLFAQLPGLLKEILGSILKDNEGALLNLDQEQPALRFFVGGYVFAVSVHRVQLLLQVLSVKRFHHQQQQQQQPQTNPQEELASSEIIEICDYFSRRVASEPYDASRVASFITLLTLPISVLREFLKLIAWEKGLSQCVETAPAPRARVELCLENHSGLLAEDSNESSASKSDIHHDRARNCVDFALTFVLDPALIPHINAAGGAAWLPYCVSVRLRYSFGENTHTSLIGMEGSHGGRACWLRSEEWERCKQRVARVVDFANGNSVGDIGQGRLKSVAETLQKTLQMLLQQLKEGSVTSSAAIS